MRNMVEGASDSALRFRRRRLVEARAPFTILRATRCGWSHFPAFAGQDGSLDPGYLLEHRDASPLTSATTPVRSNPR
jgi:hypothetical protein